MDWLFWDLTDTISLGEAIWSAIGAAGMVLMCWIAGVRHRTYRDLVHEGINGRSRLLAKLRLIRAMALAVIFALFTVMGIVTMSVPTNPALMPRNPEAIVPTLAIMAIEVLLFLKAVTEEIIESSIATMDLVKDAAQSGNTPRLSD